MTYELHTVGECTCKWKESIHMYLLQILASSLQPALGYSDWKPDSCPSPRHQTSTYAKAQPDVSLFPNAQYLEFHPRGRSERPQTGFTIGEAGVLNHLKDTSGAQERFLKLMLEAMVSYRCVDGSKRTNGRCSLEVHEELRNVARSRELLES